jgi:phosphoglycerate dehydrogenase-like enzyme
MNVAILSPIWPGAVEELKSRHRCTVAAGGGPEEVRRLLADAEAAVVRSNVRLDRAALEAAPRLRLVLRAGAGLDGIDLDCARERGVRVQPLASSVDAVAEHAFALLLALARKVAWLHRRLCEGSWEKQAGVGQELGGKTLGVLGFGRNGRRTAEMARAFRMNVLAHDRSPQRPEKQQAAAALGVRFVGPGELFESSDAVVVAAPLNEQTRGLVGADLLGRMRPGALLVNVGRGGVVDEAALYDALKSGRLSGAALDVFATEPVGDSPLLRLDNFLGTPHVGGQTADAQRRIGEAVVRAVDDFAAGRGA